MVYADDDFTRGGPITRLHEEYGAQQARPPPT